ncbi:MAG: sigma 54-interacting transcriptional regulator [Syntrophomonadaceae bacterium]|nr:sigma 54-interacting transcriptional regulator [Syntrophomonadaceae bacterium]
MAGELRELSIDRDLDERLRQMAGDKGMSLREFVWLLLQEYEHGQTSLKEVVAEFERLKEREIHALAIGDAIYDGIYVIDKKGAIVAVNKVYMEMTGIEQRELIGKPVQVLLEKRIFEKETSMQALSACKKTSAMCTIVRSNKKVLATSNPLFNSRGELVEVLTVIRDITELVRFKEELERSEEENQKYLDEIKYLRQQELDKLSLIGKSPSIMLVKGLIVQVAKVDASILITGETGVGKEVVAREIVRNSHRRNGPYIKVNCAAIPETLLESELFGYEKGAFTGAQSKCKPGFFEMANCGTILLDEIAEMPLKLQSKLLRVIQEKELVRLGDTRTIKLDVRIIATTNKDLEQSIKAGTFREDLYYRLNVVPIKIPPLRQRIADIPILADHFLKKFNNHYMKNKVLDYSAFEMLESYDWPGNIRELENVIERLIVIVPEEKITNVHVLNMLPADFDPALYEGDNTSLQEAVKLLERKIIQKALQKYKSTHKAAKALGVSQPTVFRKAKTLGIYDRDHLYD